MFLFATQPKGHNSGRGFRMYCPLTGSYPGEYRFDNEGGGGGGAGGGDEKKYFTQEDVNRIMAENKKALQAENADLKKQLGEFAAWKDEIETMLDEIAEGADSDEGGDEDTKGASGDGDEAGDGDGNDDGRASAEIDKRLRYVERKYQTQIDSLKKRVDEAEGRASDAETKRRMSERDSILTDALNKAKAVSIDGGIKIFRDNMVYDEDSGKWLFRTAEGVDVDPHEGINENLPAYLRPAVAGGGSGTGDMKGSALVAHIAGLKKQMGEAAAKAGKTNASEDIRAYQRLKEEVKEAEGKLSSK